MTRLFATKSSFVVLKRSAQAALNDICGPLSEFVLDSGMSIREAQQIMRRAAVLSVADRQIKESGRVNISGISAATGIPRSEVSRALKTSGAEDRRQDQEQCTNRVLAAWRRDTKYVSENGEPAPLKMYGRSPSFESLSKAYGRGLSPRAILDELVRTRAARIDRAQIVSLVTALSIERGANSQFVKVFGERTAQLMSTMLHNMREPESAAFVASVAESGVSFRNIPLLRRAVSVKGSEFLDEMQETISAAKSTKMSRESLDAKRQISVTVYIHESTNESMPAPKSGRRKNLRRRPK